MVRRWQVLQATSTTSDEALVFVDDAIGQFFKALRTPGISATASQKFRSIIMRLRDVRSEVPEGRLTAGQLRIFSRRAQLICAG